jgi:hypothetical protein
VSARSGSGAYTLVVVLRERVDVDRVVRRVPEVAAVRAVLEHDGHVDPLRLCLLRAADADADAVAPAVAVGVERRLDEHRLLDRVGERELRLTDAVLELEPGWRSLGRGGRGENEQRDERCHERVV